MKHCAIRKSDLLSVQCLVTVQIHRLQILSKLSLSVAHTTQVNYFFIAKAAFIYLPQQLNDSDSRRPDIKKITMRRLWAAIKTGALWTALSHSVPAPIPIIIEFIILSKFIYFPQWTSALTSSLPDHAIQSETTLNEPN